MFMNKITMEAVKEKYPNPSTGILKGTDYCVGGALARYLGEWANDKLAYPVINYVGRLLMSANPMLTENDAIGYSVKIIDENDSGCFEDAWATLGRALTY